MLSAARPEALLLESKLIKEFNPRFNIMLRDDKRYLMLKVNLNDQIPNFTFTRFKKDDGARYFGPFVNSVGLRNTVALARRQFNLRGCRVFTPGAGDYKHCLYAHLKYCTAPCVGNVTREQYLEQVRAACNFLEGQCREMQPQLEGEMKKAAAAHDFEKAADLRDLLRDLKTPGRKRKNLRACLIICRCRSIRKTILRSLRKFWICPRRRNTSKVSTFRTSAARSPWRRS